MQSLLELPDGEAVVALGANLGDAEATLRTAARELGEHADVTLLVGSFVYDTAPVGPPQPRYRNAAVRVRTRLAPLELLELLLAIERAHGRERSRETRWGPRTLDLDLLLHGREVSDGPRLGLPHPRMLERAFVLAPLLDVCPELEPLRPRLQELGGAPDRTSDRRVV